MFTCQDLLNFFGFIGVTGATNMNLHSSRSHAIFTVTIECSEKGPDGQQHVRVGKLHLVDLAVSKKFFETAFLSKTVTGVLN